MVGRPPRVLPLVGMTLGLLVGTHVAVGVVTGAPRPVAATSAFRIPGAATGTAAPTAESPAAESPAAERIAAGPAIPPAIPAAVGLLLRRAWWAQRELGYRAVQLVAVRGARGPVITEMAVAHQPGASVVQVGAVGAALTMPGPALSAEAEVPPALRVLARRYRLVLAGSALVAGRPTAVIDVRRRPAGPVVARLFLDTATGLALRRDLLGTGGTLVETVRFVRLTFLTNAGDASPPGAGTVTAAGSAPPPSSEPGRVTQAVLRRGCQRPWSCPATLGNGLMLLDARQASPGVLHLTYGDGLATVSLFEERGQLLGGSLRGWRAQRIAGTAVYAQAGLVWRAAWQRDRFVATLVGDPWLEGQPTVLADAVALVPGREAQPAGSGGTWTRLGRGLHRLANWLDPLT